LVPARRIEIGGPTTNDLTSAVCCRNSFLYELRDEVSAFVAPATCTFEDLFHVLETLDSYATAVSVGVIPKYKPRPAAVLCGKDAKWLKRADIVRACSDLIDEIGLVVESRHADFSPSGSHRWYSSFWEQAVFRAKWDICTLNYDQTIEQSVGTDAYEDGFVLTDHGFGRFDPKRLRHSTNTRILHLHGSTRYGYPVKALREFAFEDDFSDLYRLESAAEARTTWGGRSNDTSQAHETVIAGPMITGLRKTEKVTAYPYSPYRSAFDEAVGTSPLLLIAGYSFGDGYLNSTLRRMRRLHGDKCRIVIVTYVPPDAREYWMQDQEVLMQDFGWPTSGMNEFLQRIAKESRYLHTFVFKDQWISKNGCLRMYMGGMKSAITQYTGEILDFLCPPAA
jgi:hypothetical protein